MSIPDDMMLTNTSDPGGRTKYGSLPRCQSLRIIRATVPVSGWPPCNAI